MGYIKNQSYVDLINEDSTYAGATGRPDSETKAAEFAISEWLSNYERRDAATCSLEYDCKESRNHVRPHIMYLYNQKFSEWL